MQGITEIYETFKKSRKICIDSRRVQPDALFFALKGENFDGNEFVTDALSKGCIAAVTDNESLFLKNVNSDKRIFYVTNAVIALQKLALMHRRNLNIPIIGITGSNGKTTTKELLAIVLSRKHRISYTSANQNNHIGVPLTILAMNETVDIGIIEMGANHKGEIKTLCEIAEPDFGLITNIGIAHTEGFKSFEGIVKTKYELYEFLKNNNKKIFVNKDNDLLLNLIDNYQNIITYGKSEDAFCTGEYIENSYFGTVKWKSSNYSGIAKSNLIGDYNFENILAAIAIGIFFEIPSSAIDNAISSYFPKNNRSQFVSGMRNKIIYDLYNANPTSMYAAINNFKKLPNGKKCLILGDMLELGKYAWEEHKKLLDFIIESDFDKVMLVGSIFMQFKDYYEFDFFNDVTELANHLIKHPDVGKFFLVKGSRGIKLEKCTDYL